MEFDTVTNIHSVEAPDTLSILGVFAPFGIVLKWTEVDVTADIGGVGGESGLEGGASFGDSSEVELGEGDVLGMDSGVGVFLVNAEELIWKSNYFNLSGGHDFFGGDFVVKSVHEVINEFLRDVFGEFE